MTVLNRQLLSLATKANRAAFVNRSFSTTAWIQNQAPLDFSKLKITKVDTPKTLPPKEELVFGQTFTGKFQADF